MARNDRTGGGQDGQPTESRAGKRAAARRTAGGRTGSETAGEAAGTLARKAGDSGSKRTMYRPPGRRDERSSTANSRPRPVRRRSAVFGLALGVVGMLGLGGLSAGPQLAGLLDARGCRAANGSPRPLLLVADIQGDSGHRITDSLVESLAFLPGVAVRPLCAGLEAVETSGLGASQAADARRRLQEDSATGLLWGRIGEDGTLRLRLLASALPAAELPPTLFQIHALDLPLPPEEEAEGYLDSLGDEDAPPGTAAFGGRAAQTRRLLEVLALSALAPRVAGLQAMLAERVAPLREQLDDRPASRTLARRIGNAAPAAATQGAAGAIASAAGGAGPRPAAAATLPAEILDRGRRFLLLADAERQLGIISGDRPWLVRAGEAYRRGLTAFPRGRDTLGNTLGDPLAWGAAQARYADLLQRLSDAETSERRLTQAARAYRNALGVFRRDSDSLSWAALNSQLGAALARLGELQPSGGPRLGRAIAHLSQALEVFTPEETPRAWAQTTAHRARANFALGARRADPQTIAQARTDATAALTVFETTAPNPEAAEALKRLLAAIEVLPVGE